MDTGERIYRIRGENINRVQVLIDNVNRRFGNDTNGIKFDIKSIEEKYPDDMPEGYLLYTVGISGGMQFPQMKPLLRMERPVTVAGKPAVDLASRDFSKSGAFMTRAYFGSDMTDAEFDQAVHHCDMTCACCGTKRNRNSVTVFRCQEDFEIERQGRGDFVKFEKGKLYTVGDDCKDRFEGMDVCAAMDRLHERLIDSKLPRRYRDHSIDVVRFLDYVQAVGLSCIDEVMTYDNRRKDTTGKSPDEVFAMYAKAPVSYRDVKESKVKSEADFDKYSSSIKNTALKLYLYDRDGADGDTMSHDDKMRVFTFRQLTKFDAYLNDPKIHEKSKNIVMQNAGVFFGLDKQISNNNAEILASECVVHDKYAQLLCDMADAYYLANRDVDGQYKMPDPSLHQELDKTVVRLDDESKKGRFYSPWNGRMNLRVYTQKTTADGEHMSNTAVVDEHRLGVHFTPQELVKLSYQIPVKKEKNGKIGSYVPVFDSEHKTWTVKNAVGLSRSKMDRIMQYGLTTADNRRVTRMVKSDEGILMGDTDIAEFVGLLRQQVKLRSRPLPTVPSELTDDLRQQFCV